MSDSMSEAQRAVKDTLAHRGFAKRANRFFRDCDDDIRQFVAFLGAPHIRFLDRLADKLEIGPL
jgi:hypothetical protein